MIRREDEKVWNKWVSMSLDTRMQLMQKHGYSPKEHPMVTVEIARTILTREGLLREVVVKGRVSER